MPKILRALAAVCLLVSASHAGAETDAQWKPSVFNKVSKCRPLWIKLGDVPGDRNAAGRDTTFVCHPRFALSHDNISKTPDWVLEKITKAQVSGSNSRPEKGFVAEKHVPPHGRAVDADYPPKKENFARGHMAPSEDFNSSAAAMADTFVLSNAVPQIAPFNSGIWGQLEDGVRDVAFARGEIYVVTGPVRRNGNATSFTVTAAQAGCGHEIKVDGPQTDLVCKAHNADPAAKCKGGVGVPLALYKIIYDAKSNEVYAFLMPNRVYNLSGDAQANLDNFRVTVSAIENLTGLQFFRQKPQDQQDHLLQQCETKKFWAAPRPKKKNQ